MALYKYLREAWKNTDKELWQKRVKAVLFEEVEGLFEFREGRIIP